ncbi:MAG: sensor histidine kinase [Streptosporangiales bacterium]|nr:sensor histidine kinase [Streptosporangiales bacterium]
MLFAHEDELDRHRGSTWARPARWWVFLVLLTVVSTGASFGAGFHAPFARDMDPLGLVLLLAGPVLLALTGPFPIVRRRLPVAGLAVTLVATLAFSAFGYVGPVFLFFFVALVVAVNAGHRLVGWVGATVGVTAFLLIAYLRDPGAPPSLTAVTTHVVWTLFALGVAEVMRIRRERGIESVRTREEAQRRRATEQRLVIAQELHDVLAHNISMINVQAGVGLHLMDERPEQARSALAAIKQASAEALGELRSVLDVLRSVLDVLRVGDAAPRSPTPRIGGLQLLVDRAVVAGLDARIAYEGRQRELSAAVELAVFRIVQESLTNVLKHAEASAVSIGIGYGDRVLTVTIADDGVGRGFSRLPGTGSGIEGMRRRVSALGGSFEAGPVDGDGFRVQATIPVDPAPAGEGGRG